MIACVIIWLIHVIMRCDTYSRENQALLRRIAVSTHRHTEIRLCVGVRRRLTHRRLGMSMRRVPTHRYIESSMRWKGTPSPHTCSGIINVLMTFWIFISGDIGLKCLSIYLYYYITLLFAPTKWAAYSVANVCPYVRSYTYVPKCCIGRSPNSISP